MEDKDFDQLFEVPEDKDYTKKVAKRISHSIYKRVITSLIVLSLLFTGGYYGTSALVDQFYYNPNDLQLTSKGDPHSFAVLLSNYLYMYYPGYMIYPDTEGFQSDKFGKYSSTLFKVESLERMNYGINLKTLVSIKRNKLSIDYGISNSFIRNVSEFINPHEEYMNGSPYEEDYVLSELNQLPESARVDMSVSFREYYTFEELSQLITKYPELTFKWVATSNEIGNTAGVQMGFSLFHTVGYELEEGVKEKYPNLVLLERQPTGKEMETHFKSSIQLLLDNKGFIKMVNGSNESNLLSIDVNKLKSVHEDDNILLIGVNFNGKKKDVLNFLEKESVQRYSVKDVALSFMGN